MEWKRINEYNYEINNNGIVRNIKTGRTIKPFKGRYHRINLSKNGELKSFLVHRLVAIYFCSRTDGNIIHHIDNNPHNNNYKNLLWTTQSYNVKAAYDDGLVPDRTGVNNPNHKSKK